MLGCMCSMVHVWRSDDNFMKLVLFFCLYNSGWLHMLSHLTSPKVNISEETEIMKRYWDDEEMSLRSRIRKMCPEIGIEKAYFLLIMLAMSNDKHFYEIHQAWIPQKMRVSWAYSGGCVTGQKLQMHRISISDRQIAWPGFLSIALRCSLYTWSCKIFSSSLVPKMDRHHSLGRIALPWPHPSILQQSTHCYMRDTQQYTWGYWEVLSKTYIKLSGMDSIVGPNDFL